MTFKYRAISLLLTAVASESQLFSLEDDNLIIDPTQYQNIATKNQFFISDNDDNILEVPQEAPMSIADAL
jgi:hypothetical protein